MPAPFTSVMTNGSLVTRKWLAQYAACMDVLAVSIDSSQEQTNRRIGRAQGRRPIMDFDRLMQLRSWCDEFSVDFKLITVVNALNFCEDMNEQVAALEPQRYGRFSGGPGIQRKLRTWCSQGARLRSICHRRRGVRFVPLPPRATSVFSKGFRDQRASGRCLSPLGPELVLRGACKWGRRCHLITQHH
jgi:hypothetical protein